MNKKITVFTILLLAVSLFIFPANKKQELYLKAMAEKDNATKMELLKEYVTQFGQNEDKFLKFIYLNLTDTAYKLKGYDEAIQYGEKTISYEDLDSNNKLRVYFILSNSYSITKKDQDKALEYADSIITLCNQMIESARTSEQDKEKSEQFITNYRNFYIAPAYQIQAMVHYNKGDIKKAAELAVESYKINKNEQSSRMAFSLSVNLFKKNQLDAAIAAAEGVFDKENAKYNEANLLASVYYKKKNKAKAVEYYELAYKDKKKADLAMKIGQLVHTQQPQKGLQYFADAYVLSGFDKTSQPFKYLEQLYFNRIAKDKTAEEKEQGFKVIIDAAKARLGMKTATPQDNTPPTTPPAS